MAVSSAQDARNDSRRTPAIAQKASCQLTSRPLGALPPPGPASAFTCGSGGGGGAPPPLLPPPPPPALPAGKGAEEDI
eukprot:224378-Chlamydomonas_euryale.AAC.2